jgi:hypothetical protein
MNDHYLGNSIELISQLQHEKQTTFLECLTHNLFLLTQAIWVDQHISTKNKQRYLMSLNQMQIELVEHPQARLNWQLVFQDLQKFSGKSDKLNQWLFEIIDESYQTALVA